MVGRDRATTQLPRPVRCRSQPRPSTDSMTSSTFTAGRPTSRSHARRVQHRRGSPDQAGVAERQTRRTPATCPGPRSPTYTPLTREAPAVTATASAMRTSPALLRRPHCAPASKAAPPSGSSGFDIPRTTPVGDNGPSERSPRSSARIPLCPRYPLIVSCADEAGPQVLDLPLRDVWLEQLAAGSGELIKPKPSALGVVART